ncbi:selenoprotein L [Xyrichtys novacula]|uniref:Selenoprotein L n=1 Tax=Xyrichtys novacula TaxID=13765 RepID=A0AAV1GWS0_XYRNO|nr:selenoprotein L [Xyrichtys novacula]
MAEDVAVSEDTLIHSLTLLVNWSKVLLKEAKKDAEGSLEDFVPHKISTLFGLITAGADFYKSLGVKKLSEAEALWQKSYQHAGVREQVEELLQLETEWDSFLEDVDRGLQTTDRQLSGKQTVDRLSPDTELTDARSGKSVTLGQYLDHVAELEESQALLDARSVKVLVVSFGGLEGAKLWMEQTGCAYDMLLDPQRKIYRSFGLGSSYAKVMKFRCLLQYSGYGAVGIDFPDVPPRLMEDLYQMGGDFLLDGTGKVLLSHPSKNPHDRPNVDKILQAVMLGKL